jgi:hypothetical protein
LLVAFVLCWRGYAPRSCEACWILTPFSCFPFISPPTLRRVSRHLNRTLPYLYIRLQSRQHNCRADPRHVGTQGRLILWWPVKPILYILLRPRKAGETFCGSALKLRIIFEEILSGVHGDSEQQIRCKSLSSQLLYMIYYIL